VTTSVPGTYVHEDKDLRLKVHISMRENHRCAIAIRSKTKHVVVVCNVLESICLWFRVSYNGGMMGSAIVGFDGV